jgi:hypothetical protein
VVSPSPNGAAFSGQTAVQLREIMAQKIFLVTGATGATGGATPASGPGSRPSKTGARLSLAVRKLLECFAVQDGPGHVAALGG